jgi:transcriptional antiterminator NusG
MTENQEGKCWYVLHTYSGYENKVEQNLLKRIESMKMEDKVFRVVVPVEKKVELKNGKEREVLAKIYPGYVLVEMLMTDDSWFIVRNTPGVTGFVGSTGAGSKPTALDEEDVKKILLQMENNVPKIVKHYRVGDRVKIVVGPFSDSVGIVSEVFPDNKKIKGIFSVYGRDTAIEVETDDIRWDQ